MSGILNHVSGLRSPAGRDIMPCSIVQFDFELLINSKCLYEYNSVFFALDLRRRIHAPNRPLCSRRC